MPCCLAFSSPADPLSSPHFVCCCIQIKWGSGSGQQSVTGFEGADDPNSLWQVKEGIIGKTERAVSVGTVVKCGDLVRLQHASTKRWLHSHLHASPLTHRQEISGYGEEGGVGSDTGDNWRVDCVSGTEWTRDGQWHISRAQMQLSSHSRRSLLTSPLRL